MVTSFRPETARIYQFPLKRRLVGAGNRDTDRLGTDLRLQTEPGTISCSGWYHEAAIQDAERTRRS